MDCFKSYYKQGIFIIIIILGIWLLLNFTVKNDNGLKIKEQGYINVQDMENVLLKTFWERLGIDKVQYFLLQVHSYRSNYQLFLLGEVEDDCIDTLSAYPKNIGSPVGKDFLQYIATQNNIKITENRPYYLLQIAENNRFAIVHKIGNIIIVEFNAVGLKPAQINSYLKKYSI